MKKFYLFLFLIVMSFAGKAQSLLVDDFTGLTTGTNLAGQSTWIKGGTGPDVTVENSAPLTYSGYNGGGGEYVQMPAANATSSRVYKSFATTAAGTNTFYYSVLVNLSAVNATGDYFLTLGDPGTNSGYFARLFAKSSGTGFNFGISKQANVATANFGTTVFNFNQTYLVVVRYTFVTGTSNDEVYLWVNPVLTSEPPTAAAEAFNTTLGDPTINGSNVGNFHWHNRSVNNPTGKFDGVRVAYGATSSDAWTALNAAAATGPATPTTTSISPSSATAGGSAFTLTVNGTNFINGSTVTWNGSNRTTTFVSATQLTAAITAADIASAGTATVGVTTTGAPASSNTQTFTINAAATPSLTISSPLTAFGNTCINTTAGPNSFTITGSNLTAANVAIAALAGYTYSTSSGGTYTPTLSITQPGGSFSQQVFVKFTPTAVQSYDGNIAVSGGGASAVNAAASGSGVNTPPTVTAGAATGVSSSGATLPGTITATGCGSITAYGAEYSTTSGFANGTGIQLTGTNLAGGNFSVAASGLAPNTTYYYKTIATNAGGTSYSAQQSFTTANVSAPAAPVATAATGVNTTGFTANWNAVSGATNYFLDVYTLTTGSSVVDVAGWSFTLNTAASQTADVGNANNVGIQTVTPNGLGTISWPGGPTSSTGANPNSVSANGWDNGANTKYWQIDVNTTGVSNVTVSSMQGASSTGPAAFKVQYKVGAGGTWTDVAGGTVTLTTAVTAGSSTNWGIISNLPLPSAADNQPLVSIRWISTGNVAINGSAVSSTGTSRISAIYVKGTTGSGTTPVYVAGYQNLPVGNVTSYAVTGLSSGTAYYYVVRAQNAGGTSASSNEISVTTAVPIIPTLTATALTGFGNVCTNASGGPNSFTINGTNLTTANVTVGPLAGYTFSTTANGTYTNSLSLTQTGGTFSQAVFVKFNPTAVQSYNGNIPVAGGGTATGMNVAATGAGVSTAPTVTTGASSAVTNNSATLAGNITANGCTSVTSYGIEYSTVSGFANGTGTPAASTNLASGAFTSNVSGLAASTTYYYKAFATNAGGTSYGTQQSFTTAAAPPTTLTASALTGFGSSCTGVAVGPNSFTITGSNLTSANVTVGPLTGYTFSTTANGSYTPSLTLTQPGGNFSQTVFVKFTPAAALSYNGNIPVSGGGASSINVAASGTGINTTPTVTTTSATNITSSAADASGSVTATGCSNTTNFGIEYSGINNFVTGSGTQVSAGTNISSGSFSARLSGLVPGATYYFRAFATNGGGTAYGAQQSFTVAAIPDAFTVYPVPVSRGSQLNFSMNKLAPGYYGIGLYNSIGQQVYQKNFNIQVNFINEQITIPYSIPEGIYSIRLISNTEIKDTKTILVTK